MSNDAQWCDRCKKAPCDYLIQWFHVDRLRYRWEHPRYLTGPQAADHADTVRRYLEKEDLLVYWPNIPPNIPPYFMNHTQQNREAAWRMWQRKENTFMAVFDSIRTSGLQHPLVVKQLEYGPDWDAETGLLYAVTGNQRVCFLRIAKAKGWLKSPLVGCRVALADDIWDDRCRPALIHKEAPVVGMGNIVARPT